ncbi:hypothetical protein HDV00_004635, partial [Rhizophlyctis rosea]
LTSLMLGCTLPSASHQGRQWDDDLLHPRLIEYAARDVFGVWEVYKGAYARLASELQGGATAARTQVEAAIRAHYL